MISAPASSAEDAIQRHPQRPPEVQQEGVTEPEALHGAGQPEPLPVEGTSEAGDPEFNAKLAVDTPQLLVNALRMIRVAMQEFITDGKIQVCDGFVVVADLVAMMKNVLHILMEVEQATAIIDRYGAQFFQTGFISKRLEHL